MGIEVKNLTKKFDNKTVINDMIFLSKLNQAKY